MVAYIIVRYEARITVTSLSLSYERVENEDVLHRFPGHSFEIQQHRLWGNQPFIEIDYKLSSVTHFSTVVTYFFCSKLKMKYHSWWGCGSQSRTPGSHGRWGAGSRLLHFVLTVQNNALLAMITPLLFVVGCHCVSDKFDWWICSKNSHVRPFLSIFVFPPPPSGRKWETFTTLGCDGDR